MKKILSLVLISILLTSCVNNLFKQDIQDIKQEKLELSNQFIEGSEDIPQLKAMKKLQDDDLGFDSESGSIMFSSYKSEIDLEKVKNFYENTLPKMGWQLTKNNISESFFKRETQKLEIEFVNQDGQDLVRFFISSWN